jgi:uncharacterized MAPEG superfamily protein
MSIELKLLLWSVALTVVQMVVGVIGAQGQVGLPKLVGNRDDIPDLQGFAGRAQRAHRNMLENLVLFAVLVLLVQVTGKANATTALGAQLFFWGRIAYALIYWAGIPWARTAAWTVSIIGLIMIFVQLM